MDDRLSRRKLLSSFSIGVVTVSGCLERPLGHEPVPKLECKSGYTTEKSIQNGTIDWRQQGQNAQNRGRVSADANPNACPAFDWRQDFPNLIAGIPLVDDGQVFVVNGNGVTRAFELSTGELVWKGTAPNGTSGTESPVLTDDQFYFGGRGIVSLERSDGSQRWYFDFDEPEDPEEVITYGQTGALTHHDGTLIAPIQGGNIVAVDRTGPTRRWRVSTDGRELTSEEKEGPVSESTILRIENGVVDYGVAIADKSIYFGSLAGGIYSLSLETGEREWKKNLPEDSETLAPAVTGPVSVAEDRVFVPHVGGISSFDTESGKKEWQTEYARAEAGFALSENRLFGFIQTPGTLPREGYIVALNRESGNEIWRTSMVKPKSSPVLAGNVLYVDGSGLWAVDTSDGTPLITTDDAFGDGAIIVSYDHFITCTLDEMLVYSTETGDSVIEF